MYGIFTDVEPDDIIAIKVFSKFVKSNVKFFVGGRNNVIQAKRLQFYIKLFGIESREVYLGRSGGSRETGFKEDGFEIFNPDELASLKPVRTDKNYITEALKCDIFIIIKAPHDLMAHFMSNKFAFADKIAYVYGSFNLRSLKASKDDIIAFLRSFKRCYLYESFFATGENNTVNKNNFNFVKLEKQIIESIRLWDSHIAEICKITIKTSSDTNAISRSKKCLESVLNGPQFVNADVFLMLSIFEKTTPWKKIKNIKYRDAYIVTETDDTVSISDGLHVISPPDKSEYERKMLQSLNSLI